jgi:pimeloyl-ACP methyl ester carboxylesterase
VVCLHAGSGTSAQWRSLTEQLGDRYRIIACDMSSSGRSPALGPEVAYTLDAEVDFLEPVFEAAGSAFHLIGHSFGGAVALKAALRHGSRVKSLTLIEPTLFALLLADAPDSDAAREILRHTESTSRLAEHGDFDAAGEEFVDYWDRPGAWAAMREETRAGLGANMRLIRQVWDALLRDTVRLSDIAAIDVATLLLLGANSNRPTRALGDILVGALPRLRRIDMEGVGHMAPLTHPDRVNPLIDAFVSGGAA